MQSYNNETTLPSVDTFEEYETLKLNIEIFKNAAKKIVSSHQLPPGQFTLLEGTNIVFSFGDKRIIKIYPPFHLEQFTNEVLVTKHLANKLSVNTPKIEFEGKINGWPYIITNQLDGILLEGLWEQLDENNKSIIIRELGALIREVHALPVNGLEAIDCHWNQFIAQQISQCVTQHRATQLPDALLKQLPEYLNKSTKLLPTITKPVLLTGEYTPMNFLVKQENNLWHIAGLIDFGDCMLGLAEYDLLGPGAFLINGNKKILREFLLAYGYKPENINALLSQQLTTLMLLHRYSNLKIQIRINDWQNQVGNFNDIEQLVWGV